MPLNGAVGACASRWVTARHRKNNARGPAPNGSSSSGNFHRAVVWRDRELLLNGRVVATVIPDEKHSGMWRVLLPGGRISDMVNLTRAKDAAVSLAYGAMQ